MLEIYVAEVCGFCFGVQRAIEMTESLAAEKVPVATYGDLVHNPQVMQGLAQQGVATYNKIEEVPQGCRVVLRAHGVGPEIYAEAEARGLLIADATCPFVRKEQLKIKEFADNGYLPIIIGEKNHPEVVSVLAWGGPQALVLESKEEIGLIPAAPVYGIVVQTTFEIEKFYDIYHSLQQKLSGQLILCESICTATRERQEAALALAKKVDVFFVIGGKNSANTRHLYDIVKGVVSKAYHIETAEEITPLMLLNCGKVGITAGASTPDRLIREVIAQMETMEALLGGESMHLHLGMKIQGTIVAVTKEEVIIDFGYQSEGRIPFNQWSKDATREDVLAEAVVGEVVTAKVVASENQEGLVELSKIKADQEDAWNKAEQFFQENKVFTVKVSAAVKGGMRVWLKEVKLEGFIPASHLDLQKVVDFKEYIGKELQVELLEFEAAKKRLVFSRRAILRHERNEEQKQRREEREARMKAEQEERQSAEQAVYENLKAGDITKGRVRSLAAFGLFVELAKNVQGLVHTSEVSWDRQAKINELYQVGDEIEVLVKSIEPEKKRIALSIKRLTEDPWLTAAQALKEGQNVQGKVVEFAAFGAFIEITPEIKGLVHVSEIAEERVAKPEDKLKLGEEITAKILKIDRNKRNVALSIKKALAEAEKEEYTPFLQETEELAVTLADKLKAAQED